MASLGQYFYCKYLILSYKFSPLNLLTRLNCSTCSIKYCNSGFNLRRGGGERDAYIPVLLPLCCSANPAKLKQYYTCSYMQQLIGNQISACSLWFTFMRQSSYAFGFAEQHGKNIVNSISFPLTTLAQTMCCLKLIVQFPDVQVNNKPMLVM